MELIVHDNVKNAVHHMVLAGDGYGVTFLFEHLLLPNKNACLLAGVHAYLFVVLATIIRIDPHRLNSSNTPWSPSAIAAAFPYFNLSACTAAR